MVPSLHADFSTEALFVRERLGGPLEWTGALPPSDLAGRLEEALPDSVSLQAVCRGDHVEW